MGKPVQKLIKSYKQAKSETKTNNKQTNRQMEKNQNYPKQDDKKTKQQQLKHRSV